MREPKIDEITVKHTVADSRIVKWLLDVCRADRLKLGRYFREIAGNCRSSTLRWFSCSAFSRRRLVFSYQVTRCADSSITYTAPCVVSLADKSRYFRVLPASCAGVRPVLQQQMRSLPQMAQLEPQRAASSVVAAALALALSAANPMMTHASIEQPAVVRCSSGHRDVVLGLMLSIPLVFLTRAVAFAWQVQRYGGSMIAVDAIEASDADLREAQKKFLEERAKLKQTYEASTDSTYKGADETGQKKNIYVTIVGGLIVLAFVVPMLQFFYYTGGYVAYSCA